MRTWIFAMMAATSTMACQDDRALGTEREPPTAPSPTVTPPPRAPGAPAAPIPETPATAPKEPGAPGPGVGRDGGTDAGPKGTTPTPERGTPTTPPRTIALRHLLDDQVNDARGSSGAIYWEGAVRAFDASGQPIGKGYLELTGYGARIRF